MMSNIHLNKKKNISYAVAVILVGVLFCMFFFYFDKKIIQYFSSLRHSTSRIYVFLEFIDPVINVTSHGTSLLLLAIGLFAAGKFRKSNRYEPGSLLIKGFIFSGITAQILKHLAGRARPRVTFETLFSGPSIGDSYHSFPSGHTAVAFCFAYILAKYLPRYRIYFYLLASIMGFERIEELKHFPSDVVAGAVIGIAVGMLLSNKIKSRNEISAESSL